MKSEIASSFPYISLIVVGFFLFAGVYSFMFWWTFNKKNKAYMNRCEKLPFEGDKHE
jgi:hypothetical protein